MTARKSSSRLQSIIIALVVVFIWSTSWILVKYGLNEIPALTFASFQNTLAFICLVPIALLARKREPIRIPPKKVWIKLAALGLLQYAATQGTLFLALSFLPAVTTNLIGSFSSVVVALFAILFLSEWPVVWQWIGIGACTMGAALYFGPTGIQTFQIYGLMFAIASVFTNAGALIVGRDINRDKGLSPLFVTVASMGIGSLTLAIFSISTIRFPQLSLKGWALVCWLAIVNTALGCTLWNYVLRSLSAVESIIIIRTMMVWIALMAVVFLHERLSLLQIVSLVLVGVGTLLVQLKQTRKWHVGAGNR